MKFTLAALLSLMAISSAYASPLTEETLAELHEVNKTKEHLDLLIVKHKNEIDMLANSMISSGNPNEAQIAAIEKMRTRMHASIESELDFSVIEKTYRPMYMNTLTEEEARGMIEFNKSPAGMAIVKKMPVIVEFITEVLKTKMNSVSVKTMAIQKDFQREIDEAKNYSNNL